VHNYTGINILAKNDLLQQPRLIVQYTSINDNAQLLGCKDNIHEVHILGWMIFRALHHLHTNDMTQPAIIFPSTV